MPFENLLNISVKKDWVDYLSALLTPTVAVLGIVIAYRQWRTEEARRRHELFDRRYKQFDAVVKFVYSVVSCTSLTDEKFVLYQEIMIFEREIAGIQFIFNPEIKNYVSEQIIKPSKKIQQLRSKYDRIASEEERGKNRACQEEIYRTLWDNLQIFQEKTLKYMQLDYPSPVKELFKNLAALFEKIKSAAD